MRSMMLFLLLLLVSAGVSSQVYTWRDASGKVHYSDTPPTGTDAKQLRGGATVSNDGGAQRRSINEQEQEFRKRRAASEEKRTKSEKEIAEADIKRKDCEQARSQLKALESGERMTKFNDKGERVFLEDAERTQEADRLRKQVEQLCRS
jgi:hypothetical protein